MNLIPAIDLLEGRCVRLFQGDFGKSHFYETPAEQIASGYAAAGAEWLHVVDLAASRDGKDADTASLLELLGAVRQKVQTGGGVRAASDVQLRLEAGADRVVVGSIAVSDPLRFARWIKRFGPERLVAALDVRLDGSCGTHLRVHGWTHDSGKTLWDVMAYLTAHELRHVLCTDISRDGALCGPNIELYRAISARHPQVRLQASGGVRDIDDLRALSESGAAAAISGKALLEGRFTIEAALAALGEVP